MTTVFSTRSYGRFIEIQSNRRRKKLHTTNQVSNFLGSSFSDGGNVGAPIQFGRERQPQHLKRWFFLKSDPFVFTQITPKSLNWSNKTSSVFPALKSTSHLLPQYRVSHRSDPSSETRNGGPGMEPWGTSALTGYSCKDFSSRTTWTHLTEKHEIRPK